MPLGDIFNRRQSETQICAACGAVAPLAATFCNNCGIRLDDPDAQPLHIVDRSTGLFNDRFIRPVLEDELARAHRYGRALGIVLIEPVLAGAELERDQVEEVLKVMAAALAATVRDVDTPGVLGRRPPQLLTLLPDTDISGTAHAANRILEAVQPALAGLGRQAQIGIVCVHPIQRVRAGAVVEAAGRALRAGRPELLGR